MPDGCLIATAVVPPPPIQEGQASRLRANMKTTLGVYVDPDTVRLKLLKPDWSVTEYVYDTDPEVIRLGPGLYRADIVFDQPGTWRIRWEADGANVQGAAERVLAVQDSEVV